MSRLIFALSMSILFSSCSSTYYLLASAPEEDLSPESGVEAAVSSSQGIALLYDREPWLAVESVDGQGDVWLHYGLTLKNDTDREAFLNSSSVVLNIGNKNIRAYYEKTDAVAPVESLAAQSYFWLSVSFPVKEEWLEEFADENRPLFLKASLEGVGELKLPLWLWEE